MENIDGNNIKKTKENKYVWNAVTILDSIQMNDWNVQKWQDMVKRSRDIRRWQNRVSYNSTSYNF